MAGIPAVENLRDAMGIWTIRGMARVVLNPSFQPSSWAVSGKIPGAKEKAFQAQVENFFPLSRPGLKNTVWSPFVKIGYLQRYHRICREGSGAAMAVQQGLADIFNRLQCLPIVIPGKQLWKVSSAGGILFAVNSKYFKFEKVGKAKPAPKAPRAKATNSVIEWNIKSINGELGPTREEAQRVMAERKQVQKSNAARKGRSGAAKNARAPPARRKGAELHAQPPAMAESPKGKSRNTQMASQREVDELDGEHNKGASSSREEDTENDEQEGNARQRVSEEVDRFGSEAGDDEHGSSTDDVDGRGSSVDEMEAMYALKEHEYASSNSSGGG